MSQTFPSLPQDVCHGAFAEAAALAYSLGRMRWLERSNTRVAVAVAHAYLVAAGGASKLDQERETALVVELKKDSCTAQSVAAVLKAWVVWGRQGL